MTNKKVIIEIIFQEREGEIAPSYMGDKGLFNFRIREPEVITDLQRRRFLQDHDNEVGNMRFEFLMGEIATKLEKKLNEKKKTEGRT